MRKRNLFSLIVVGAATLTSCSKMGALSLENFTVTPTPLEAIGGKVPVTVNGQFPKKYLKKNAVVTVTPVLKHSNGQVAGQSATFQGEKVQGNNQTVIYKTGRNYTLRSEFDYTSAMDKSDLYMTFAATRGKKRVSIPEVKVSYGVLSTSTLLTRTLATTPAALAPDAFERVLKQQQQATIKFLVAQANLRNSELTSETIKQFVETLRQINNDNERKALENIEVSAYASPEGSLQLNTRLAQERQNVSTQYVDKQLRANNMNANVDTKYTAEDWDGFQELVKQSRLEDKDLILRVLSMYNDPEERERQIRNISTVYTELAASILPELRRARLTINYQLIGRSDREIVSEFAASSTKLSIEEILYGAGNLVSTVADKKTWYQRATTQYPNDYRAYNNLAMLAYESGDIAEMERQLQKAKSLEPNAAPIHANYALIALKNGDVAQAETHLGKSSGVNNFDELVGCLNIAKGNYPQAATSMQKVNSNSAALAYLLNKDYSMASKVLGSVKNTDATTAYLKAIVAARTGDANGVVSNLKTAITQDATLRAKAINDLEFARYSSTLNAL